uniref:Pinin_SDK_memA domain-containing protein n=1 Tax=Steinernema glaseri TaxID=37863 RepID=A0A1I7YJA2_9BILA
MTLRTDSLNSKIEQAYDDLRGIESKISTITGRPSVRDRLAPVGAANRRRSEPDQSFFTDRRVQTVGDKRRLLITAADNGPSSLKRGRLSLSSRETVEEIDEEDEKPIKRSLQSTVVLPTIETKSRAAAINEMKETENKTESGRNRRMFANLLVGTLRRFEKDEKKISDVEKVQATKQREVERRLEQTREEERTKLNRERDELQQQRQQKEREIMRLKRDKAIVQYADEKEAHYKRLLNFIQTKAKPSVFYAPAKHTMRTLELQKDSAKKIEDLIAEVREKVKQDLSTLTPEEVDESMEVKGAEEERVEEQAATEPEKDNEQVEADTEGDVNSLEPVVPEQDDEEHREGTSSPTA